MLLGVEDDGSLDGLTRKNLEEWVMYVCHDKIKSAIIPFFGVSRDFVDGNDNAIVRVTRGFDVHALRHKNIRRYLARAGARALVQDKRVHAGRVATRVRGWVGDS